MKYLFLLLSFLITFNLNAQVKYQTVKLLPDGNIVLSDSTVKGHLYNITVEGTYSMWPQFTDCHGVDAVYVYEAPQEEIDNFRWPPEKVTIGGVDIEIFPLPHWVGDPKVYELPPPELGTPIFKMNMRDYKGFRIDDEPLPNSGFQGLTHKYSIKKYGSGEPFKFQILDSNRSIIEEKTIPRYEDNCGEIIIKIEDLDSEDPDDDDDSTGTGGNGGDDDFGDGDVDVEIGKVERWYDNGKDIGTMIEVSFNVEDSTSITGENNILDEIDPNQIGIISDGIIICDIDSIVCNQRTEPFSILLLIDNTESMQGPISEEDNAQRMKASKEALTKFVENLLPEDEVMLISFNEDTKLETDWTVDKELIKTSISNIQSEDKLTSVYKSVSIAIDSLALRDKPNKVLIVLSDGGNTFPPTWEESNVLDEARKKAITTFIVALGFTDLEIDVKGKERLEQIANVTPKGKLFSVYNSSELVDVYKKLANEFLTEEDCYVYFKNDSCEPGEERWVRIIYAPNDSTIITKVVKYNCPDVQSVKEIIY
jgi:hypothetical protein